MTLQKDALDVLKETSRTFYIPISRLPVELQEAVTSAYLCMRAIDEIEDTPNLENRTKAKLLRAIGLRIQETMGSSPLEDLSLDWEDSQEQLPQVSLRIGDWMQLAPKTIAPRIWEATASMADRMAYWSECNWRVETEADLNAYTFSVAGAVGLLLSDLWAWYDNTQTDRSQAVGFGRGLQAVNILRNRHDDLHRGVNFFPIGWGVEEMQAYARRNLALADAYTQALPLGPALEFCQIPLALAHATLEILALGGNKLSRSEVMALIAQVTGRG